MRDRSEGQGAPPLAAMGLWLHTTAPPTAIPLLYNPTTTR